MTIACALLQQHIQTLVEDNTQWQKLRRKSTLQPTHSSLKFSEHNCDNKRQNHRDELHMRPMSSQAGSMSEKYMA